MTISILAVILTLTIPLLLVFTNRLREDIAALIMVSTLILLQLAGLPVLGPQDSANVLENAIRGFGSPTIITLIALFIVTATLEKYGLASWIAGKLITLGGKSENRLIGLFALTAAIVSMVMVNMAAGALLLPSALEASRRTGIKPSKLLLPISIGTMLGGSAFYLSTANIIISGLLPSANPPQAPLGILDFTPTGGFVTIIGVAFLAIFGKKLLPDREPPTVYKIPGSRGLTSIYDLQERLWKAQIPEGSAIHNQTLAQADLGKTLGISVLAVRRQNRILPADNADFLLQQGDVLVTIGREERVKKLTEMGFVISGPDRDSSFESSDLIFAEAIIPPHSPTEGKTLREMAFRAKSGFTVIALWRENRSYRTDVADFNLKAGDALLLIGLSENINRLKRMPDIIVVETAVSRNGMDKPKVLLTSGVVLASISAMIMGVPIFAAMLIAAVFLLVSKLISMEEAYRAIQWRVVFLIAGFMSISVAMVQTGLAGLIGNALIKLVNPLGGLGLAIGAILITAGISQVMGSQIAPLLTGPIMISAAIELGVNAQAIAVAVGISTAIVFLTPLSHPVHLIMMLPGNYEHRDFIKIGTWMSLVCFISLIISLKLFWQI